MTTNWWASSGSAVTSAPRSARRRSGHLRSRPGDERFDLLGRAVGCGGGDPTRRAWRQPARPNPTARPTGAPPATEGAPVIDSIAEHQRRNRAPKTASLGVSRMCAVAAILVRTRAQSVYWRGRDAARRDSQPVAQAGSFRLIAVARARRADPRCCGCPTLKSVNTLTNSPWGMGAGRCSLAQAAPSG